MNLNNIVDVVVIEPAISSSVAETSPLCCIKRVYDTDIYDVFTGEGWLNHTRIEYHNDIMSYVSGNKLGRDEKRDILHQLRGM